MVCKRSLFGTMPEQVTPHPPPPPSTPALTSEVKRKQIRCRRWLAGEEQL